MSSRLTRSRTDRVVGGVCGGLGAYLKVDPLLVRLFFVLLALGDGIGVLLYLLLWILVPAEGAAPAGVEETIRAGADEIAGRAQELGQNLQQAVTERPGTTATAVGAALILLGMIFLLRNLDFVWLRWFDWDQLWPLVLIAAGTALLWRRMRGT